MASEDPTEKNLEERTTPDEEIEVTKGKGMEGSEMVEAEVIEGKEESEEESKRNGEELKRRRRGNSSYGEPKTPMDRPARERKIVERYLSLTPEKVSASKGLAIHKGNGMQLKDIPNVAFKLSKRKPDENLQLLHAILFGKRTKIRSLKRNIHQFSGFVWEEHEEKHRAKLKEKLDKCVKDKLLDFCDVLDIQVSTTTKKDELLTKLLEFLESPCATREVSLAEKEQILKGKKRKRRVLASTGTASRKSSGMAKKQKNSSKDDEADEGGTEYADMKAESDEDIIDSAEYDVGETMQNEESDHVDKELEDEEDKAKEETKSRKASGKKSKKGSSEAVSSLEMDASMKPEKIPSKSMKCPSNPVSKKGGAADKASGSPLKFKGSVSKKHERDEKKSKEKQNKSSEREMTSNEQPKKTGAKLSRKEQGKDKVDVNPAKPKPSKAKLHAAVSDILKEVDFNTATLSDILKQLGNQFGMDLMHRKIEVKSIIEEVINSMTDEEDEDDEPNEDAVNSSEEDTNNSSEA